MEIEIKLLLEPEEAHRLRARLGPPGRVVHQRNLYFDDVARRLARAGWGLRLRRESSVDGTASWLTLKHRGERVDDFVQRPEYERQLGPGEFEQLRDDPRRLVREARALLEDPGVLPEVDVVQVGELINDRHLHALPGDAGLVAEFDHTRWPDGSETDELELEVDDPDRADAARERLSALFAETGVAWRPGGASKLARLLHMLDER